MKEQTIRILFVEDVETDKQLAERELVSQGFKFVSKRVETEESYINELNIFNPDLVISDYSMPSFDGMSALKILLEKKLEIPFIILTGSMNENIAVECMKTGADDYILKENLARLVPAIKATLSKHENIKAKRDTEKALIESEKRFKSLFLENLAVMLLVDPATHMIIDANYAAEKFYGWKREELLKMKIEEISVLSATDISKQLEVIISQEKVLSNFQHRLSDGSIRDVEVSISAIDSRGKKVIHSIIHDITETVKQENELKKYREKLEELVAERTNELAEVNKQLVEQLKRGKLLEKQLEGLLHKEKEINELKTKFIATVSHEFRTPLSAIYSSAQLIQHYSQDYKNEKLIRHCEIIESTIDYLTSLLDDVLTINRVDRQVIKNTPIPNNIVELVTTFEHEVENNLTDKHKLNVNISAEKSTIEVDSKLLRHSVMNLLTNAIKYSPNGGNINMDVLQQGDSLKISISDEGLGIPDEEMKYVFDAFYRTQNTTGIQGTGLGLNIVRASIEAMGGNVNVKSKLNEGSTFTINVPIGKNGK